MSKDISLNIKNHDFLIPNGDTDSISFCKPDMTPFTPEQVKELLQEMNDISAEYMDWEDDGYYKCVIVLKAKNYVLLKVNKKTGTDEIILKGSGLKDSKKEPILKRFMGEIIDGILYEKNNTSEIYEKYCNLARNIVDINPWGTKKSITKNLLLGDAKQKKDVLAAIGDVSQIREGDKVFIYNTAPVFVPDLDEEGNEILTKTGKNKGKPKGKFVKVLKLTKNYANDADVEHYLSRVYATLSIFENVLDMEQFQCYTE